MVTKNFGYTLVELMVVLAILGVLSVMALYANRSFTYGQAVRNAQLKLLSDLRGTQTGVNSGALGKSVQVVSIPVNGSTYTVDSRTVTLPTGVTFLNPAAKTICFVNVNYTTPYMCPMSFPIVLTLRHPSINYTRTVTVDGSGLTINRIYAD